MKELIQQLIGEGRTEEALTQLVQLSNDGVLLLSRYNAGKRQFNNGMIEYSEWARIQAQLNYAALELANSLKPTAAATPIATATPTAPAASGTGKKVFISYNHNDHFVMRAVKDELEKAGIQVHVDVNDMSAGESIQGFIDEAFKNNEIILSIISRNSLLSGWVNKEMTTARVLNTFNKNWIPVSIDDACFNNDFVFEANTIIEKKMSDLKEQIMKALSANISISSFTDELKRQEDLKSNISGNIAELKGLLVVDIRPNVFDGGMAKVIKTIQAQLNK